MDSVMPGKWWFHNEVQGAHLLFESLVLDSGGKLFLGYVFIVAICWSERAMSYYLDQVKHYPGWRQILLRTALYTMATVFRLWYMLITMYFNTGLFIVVVASLSSGHFALEYIKSQKQHYYRQDDDGNEYTVMFDKDGGDEHSHDQYAHKTHQQLYSGQPSEDRVHLQPVYNHNSFELDRRDTRNADISSL